MRRLARHPRLRQPAGHPLVRRLARPAPSAARIARRAALVVAMALAIVVLAGIGYFLSLGGVGDAPARARRIMTAHGVAPGELPTPPKLVAAVISVEDEHFYSNVVVNVLTGAGRAALATLHTSQDPGGSTIDQQLARKLYGRGHGLFGTLREIGLGVRLAITYTKRQILQMYLNVNYYGHGYWGVRNAAEGYFHVTPAQLTWAEASMLAGLLQAPSAYDPLTHYVLAKARQDHVLSQLVVNRYLTPRQARLAFAAPLPLA